MSGEILLSPTTVKVVMVSINTEWWDCPVSVGRVKGRISTWTSKKNPFFFDGSMVLFVGSMVLFVWIHGFVCFYYHSKISMV